MAAARRAARNNFGRSWKSICAMANVIYIPMFWLATYGNAPHRVLLVVAWLRSQMSASPNVALVILALGTTSCYCGVCHPEKERLAGTFLVEKELLFFLPEPAQGTSSWCTPSMCERGGPSARALERAAGPFVFRLVIALFVPDKKEFALFSAKTHKPPVCFRVFFPTGLPPLRCVHSTSAPCFSGPLLLPFFKRPRCCVLLHLLQKSLGNG